MLTIVTWKWPPKPGYRSAYGPETVNIAKAMVDRHYTDPHRFLCVTHEAAGIDPSVEIVTPWDDYAELPSPHGANNPSCYRRLRMFHPEIGRVFGDRFVSIDLDMVFVGDLRPVWNRPEPIVLYGDTNPLPGSHYNGSMILMTAGCRPQVWERFDPASSPKLAKRAGCWGSDQGWLSFVLGPHEAKFTKSDGVYSYRNHLSKQGGRLPSDAKVVVCHGKFDPWHPQLAALPWVQEHYTRAREAVA